MAKISFTQIKEHLALLGHKDVRTINPKAIGVVVPKTRVDKLVPELANYFQKFKPVIVSDRELKLQDFSIFARNANVQRQAKAFTMGRGNEHNLMTAINEYVLDYGKPIDIEFNGKGKKFALKDIMKVVHVGAKEVFQRNKADLHLVTSRMVAYPISIKDESASFWESADSYWGEKARAFLAWAIDARETKLTENGDGGYSIQPTIAVAATAAEIKDVVFGADIYGKGAVVVEKFDPQDFKWDFDRDVLVITVKKLIRTEADVNGDVFFQIQNDRTRATQFLAKGMRTKAATAAAVTKPGNKTFDRNMRSKAGI